MKCTKNRRFRLFALVSVLATFWACNNSENHAKADHDHVLWYDTPAAKWEEALPVGNGRIGAMVFGKTPHERIQLNDDSLWPGENDWFDNDGRPNDLETIRQLLLKNKNKAADRLVVKKYSRNTVVRSHQTLGELFIDLGHENVTDYKRSLKLNEASCQVSYKVNGELFTEEVLASNPARAILIELKSESKKGLNGKISLSRPKDKGFATVDVRISDDGCLIMNGEVKQRGGMFDSQPAPILEGVKFETRLRIKSDGGEVFAGDDYLELKGVKKATFYIVSNSSFYYDDYRSQNIADMAQVENRDFTSLKEEHVKDFQRLYNRVDLQLSDAHLDTLPTDRRLANVRNGYEDLGLEELLFNYGRYLLISSSREGTNPANLQGLWNKHIEAPWNADYHLNINLQMNYWLANVTNLDELNMPLFDYVDRLVESGKETAQNNFGCGGTFIPHATDLRVPTWLRAPTAFWGSFFGAGGWMVQHYWQHYEFTRDTAFLQKRAFPAIHQVAQFYSDWIIEDPRDGKLVSAPSSSPENRYFDSNGDAVALCLGSAIDQQVIAEVFDNYMKTCDILSIDNKLVHKIKVQRPQLRSGFQIGSDGRLLEWDREYSEVEPAHRHMSHLYGFHPGVAVSKDKHPEVFDAVGKSIDYRLSKGAGGIGWSRSWLINFSARLLDGNKAHEHIKHLLKKSTAINLFNSHPPFQIEGNFGYTAGVAEMLLQSHEKGLIRILPALPEAWKDGHVKGLKARGNIIVDIVWSNGELKSATLVSQSPQKFTLAYGLKMIDIDLQKSQAYTYVHQ